MRVARRGKERQVRVLPRVIFVGGAPMSGKSTVAAGLAAELGRAVISTDDLGAAVRAVAPRDVAPDLHAFATQDHRRYHVETPVELELEHALAAHAARFAERSVAFDSYLRSAVRKARLPLLELQGTESPAEVAGTIRAALAASDA